MYTVLGHLRSRTFRVVWALEELDQPYDLQQATPQSPEIRAVNPFGKIPALIDGDTTLTDSAAILTYLSDKYGALTHPAGTLERARQDALTFAILDEMEAPVWSYAKHSFAMPEEHRVPAVKDSLKWEFSRGTNALTQRLGEGPYLMGDTFTIADIIATHVGNWATKAGFPITDDYTTYLNHTRARPAYQRADARDA